MTSTREMLATQLQMLSLHFQLHILYLHMNIHILHSFPVPQKYQYLAPLLWSDTLKTEKTKTFIFYETPPSFLQGTALHKFFSTALLNTLGYLAVDTGSSETYTNLKNGL